MAPIGHVALRGPAALTTPAGDRFFASALWSGRMGEPRPKDVVKKAYAKEVPDTWDESRADRDYKIKNFGSGNADGKDLNFDTLGASLSSYLRAGELPPAGVRVTAAVPEGTYSTAGLSQPVIERELMCIEFPGAVDNPAAMLTMLGGREWLGKVIDGHDANPRLTFRHARYRPTPAFGSTESGTSLLVRVRTKKRKNPQDKPLIETRVRGVVRRTITFNHLADFQFQPPPGLLSAAGICGNLSQMTQIYGGSHANREAQAKQPAYMAPLLFCRSDKPAEYQFRENPYSRRAVVNHSDGSVKHERVLSLPPPQSYLTHRAWLDLEVPSAPSPMAVELLRRHRTAMEMLPKVKEMFERRPVWSRTSLCLALSPEIRDIWNVLKILLSVVAFAYTSGPYRKLYIRLGYDVRAPPKDGEVHPVLYEMMDLRVGRKFQSALLKDAAMAEKYRPSMVELGAPARDDLYKERFVAREGWPKKTDPIFWDRLPLSWDNLFKLMMMGGATSSRVLQQNKKKEVALRSLFVQYCDVSDPNLIVEVQRVCAKQCSTTKNHSAWLSYENISIIRANVSAKYQVWHEARYKGKNVDTMLSLRNTLRVMTHDDDDANAPSPPPDAEEPGMGEEFDDDIPLDDANEDDLGMDEEDDLGFA